MFVDFNEWTGSLLIVLLMGGIIAGFSALVSALMIWIWRDDPKASDMPTAMRNGKEHRIRKAA